ncbi:MAG: alpha-hydroxy-acid oxidizing protein [Gammaproteobacteria bacterium]|nr:alpha-hydroxy-acid oxidizing protein [Gammaproteobacteria bacterium]
MAFTSTMNFNTKYPCIEDLRKRAKQRIPRFVFEYLDAGCDQEVNLRKNTDDIREIELVPQYLNKYAGANMQTELFGHVYDAPFGVSPVGLQGFIWPNSPEILATAALEHNIPFIQSTVTTSSIERISELSEGRAWFQLYHPAENRVRDDILKRAETAQCPVLVLLCDVPTSAFRPKEIQNGLAVPPKMSAKNILQIMAKPGWAMQTLKYGQPNFEVLKPYMPGKLNLKELGAFMEQAFCKRMDEEKIAPIRDLWKGKLVLKGVASEADAETAIRLGLDGIIVSNHGGRQLDAAESTIKPLTRIAKKYGDQITVMMDSGLRSGPDVARTLASGAQFTFMGRSFTYGVAALGNEGGDHTISILKTQLQKVMEQIGCEKTRDFPNFLAQ